jgi:hypothetical protein
MDTAKEMRLAILAAARGRNTEGNTKGNRVAVALRERAGPAKGFS